MPEHLITYHQHKERPKPSLLGRFWLFTKLFAELGAKNSTKSRSDAAESSKTEPLRKRRRRAQSQPSRPSWQKSSFSRSMTSLMSGSSIAWEVKAGASRPASRGGAAPRRPPPALRLRPTRPTSGRTGYATRVRGPSVFGAGAGRALTSHASKGPFHKGGHRP